MAPDSASLSRHCRTTSPAESQHPDIHVISLLSPASLNILIHRMWLMANSLKMRLAFESYKSPNKTRCRSLFFRTRPHAQLSGFAAFGVFPGYTSVSCLWISGLTAVTEAFLIFNCVPPLLLLKGLFLICNTFIIVKKSSYAGFSNIVHSILCQKSHLPVVVLLCGCRLHNFKLSNSIWYWSCFNIDSFGNILCTCQFFLKE